MTSINNWHADARKFFEKLLRNRFNVAKKNLSKKINYSDSLIVQNELNNIYSDIQKYLDMFLVKKVSYRHEMIFSFNKKVEQDKFHPASKFLGGRDNGCK